MNSSADLSRWDCYAGDVAFTLTAPFPWLSTQRAYLSDFLTTPPGQLHLAKYNIRVHTDDPEFRQITEAVGLSPATSYIEPVPGLVMGESSLSDGRRRYVIVTDDVEHRPDAYAVAVQGRDIDLFTHSGTVRADRYPIRLVREAMLRTYEDAGGVIFHAAGIDVGGAAVMVCGPRGSGKTTMTAALLRLPGAALLSNDRLIASHGDHVVAVPLPVPTARGTIQAFPELEQLARQLATSRIDLDGMPADFGSTVKYAFSARQFAEAFGARLISHSAIRLVIVPRLTDTAESGHVSRLPVAEAREVIAASCFTPRDEFWVQPWLVPRRRTDEELNSQAAAAIEHLAATVPCVEVRFGVRSPIADLADILEQTTGGAR